MASNYLQRMAGNLGSGMGRRGMGVDPQRRMAQQLMAQGVDTSPARLGTGIGRLGKALAAAYMMRQSEDQETDAMKWMTAKDPRTRPPTEAEAYATSPALRNLQAVEQEPGIQGFDLLHELPPQTQPDGLEKDLFKSGELKEETNWLDGLRHGKNTEYNEDGSVKKIVMWKRGKAISRTGDKEGTPRPPTSDPMFEKDFPLEEDLSEDSLFTADPEIPETPQEITSPYGQRDYAQELASGMGSYQRDPANQISDPRTRMEWLRESASGKEGNPLIRRMLQNMMFADIARGDEEKLYQRGRKDKLEDRKFGKRPTRTKRSATQGMVYDETFNPQKGTWDRGDDYDPNLKSAAAQAQFVQGKDAGKTTWTIGVDSAGNPVQRSSQGKEIPVAKAPVSKAVDVVDKEFGKFYAKHFATGGVHDAIKSLDQLDSVIRRLDAVAGGTSKENLTGPVIGLRPNWLSSMVNPEQVDTQNMIEEVVQRNLRVVLGAQFTEKEGERLIARAYNPQLGEAENAVRVQRLVDAMRNTLSSQMKAADYYEKNNSLAGWKGTHTLSVADLEKIIDGDESQLTTGEFGNVKFPNVRTDRTRKTDGLSPEKKQRLKELRRKARGQ